MNLCLGAGNFGTSTSRENAFAILDRYLELGGTLIDTANVYARWGPEKENLSEQYIGQWLRERNAYDRICVATKGGHYDLDTPQVSRVRRDCIRRDLEESLRSLGLERITLYWIHKDDREVPVEELVDIMEGLVEEGLISHYGASNMHLDRAIRARSYAKGNGLAGICAFQNRLSLAVINPDHPAWRDPGTVIPEDDFLAWHEETQTPLFAYSSLAQGFFEKWSRGNLPDSMKAAYLNPQNEQTGRRLLEESRQTGFSLSACSLMELTTKPFPLYPIVAVSRVSQLDDLSPCFSRPATGGQPPHISQL